MLLTLPKRCLIQIDFLGICVMTSTLVGLLRTGVRNACTFYKDLPNVGLKYTMITNTVSTILTTCVTINALVDQWPRKSGIQLSSAINNGMKVKMTRTDFELSIDFSKKDSGKKMKRKI